MTRSRRCAATCAARHAASCSARARAARPALATCARAVARRRGRAAVQGPGAAAVRLGSGCMGETPYPSSPRHCPCPGAARPQMHPPPRATRTGLPARGLACARLDLDDAASCRAFMQTGVSGTPCQGNLKGRRRPARQRTKNTRPHRKWPLAQPGRCATADRASASARAGSPAAAAAAERLASRAASPGAAASASPYSRSASASRRRLYNTTLRREAGAKRGCCNTCSTPA